MSTRRRKLLALLKNKNIKQLDSFSPIFQSAEFSAYRCSNPISDGSIVFYT